MVSRDPSTADIHPDRLHIAVYLDNRGRLTTMADEVRQGLTSTPKTLPPKYFYDERGSELFERVTALPEYYPARAEHRILAAIAEELMAALRPVDLVELGSGSSIKTRVLLDAKSCPAHLTRYVPMDVSEAMLRSAALELLERRPFLKVHGVVGDFERDLDRVPPPVGPRLVLFLGSTLGNLEPAQRSRFFSSVRPLLGVDGRFLLGVDLVKDLQTLNAAYNDSAGVTAKFNRNILQVINNGLRANFDPAAFRHHAFYNGTASRIEMHLVADREQTVYVRDLDLTSHIAAGESIWTESSYKFTRETVAKELEEAGMRLEQWHTGPQQLFGLALAAAA